MQYISLIKRLFFYSFLLLLICMGVLSVLFLGGRSGMGFYDVIFIYLVPHYIFAHFFLKTNRRIKLLVPFITTIISCSSFWLIGGMGVFNSSNSDIFILLIFFLPHILIWEFVYQILISYYKS